jgi:hypothetical protein
MMAALLAFDALLDGSSLWWRVTTYLVLTAAVLVILGCALAFVTAILTDDRGRPAGALPPADRWPHR